MDLIIQGIKEAFLHIIRFDREFREVVSLTFIVSGTATFISMIIGVSIGVLLGTSNFRGKKFIISLVNTGMGLPPVLVGLVLSILLWRNGPLGVLKILYTPTAMIIAQTIISLPIIIAFSTASIQNLHPKLKLQILALGANRIQTLWTMIKEARLPLVASVIAGFGAVISEVGAAMMVGGNIKGYTRVLTTAIVMETSRGNFSLSIAWGIILLIITYFITLILTLIQQS